MKALAAIAVLAILLVWSAPAFGQCAMCYQTAAAQGAKGKQALNWGILVLLVPPAVIGGCIGVVTYRHRESPSGSHPR